MTTKTCYLIRTTVEHYNLHRGWFVNAYRIVDENGVDLINPYPETKKEALDCAKTLGRELIDNTHVNS